MLPVNSHPALSSRDIAETTEKEHKTVLRDIRTMLTALYGPEEDGTDLYHPGVRIERDGRGYIVLISLDREHAMTLVTGYDVRLRKKVVDRLAQLDGAGVSTLAGQIDATASVFDSLQRIARTAGILGNQALLAASQGTAKLTGFAPLALIGATHLEAPHNEALLTPSTIGKELGGRTAKIVNAMLIQAGLQTAHRDHRKRLFYEPTEQGIAAGAIMSDTGKKKGDGSPVRQLRWSFSIIAKLRALGRPEQP